MLPSLFALAALFLLPSQGEDAVARARGIFQSLKAKPSAMALEEAEQKLSELGEDALPALRESVKGTDAGVVGLAAKLLQKWGNAEDARSIYEMLAGNPAQEAVVPCLRALFALDPQSAPERALHLLEHKLSAVRAAAANELVGKLRPEHAVEVLRLSQAKREDSKVRALGLLGSFASDECLSRLLAALSESQPEAAAAASAALARSPHPQAQSKLVAVVAEAYLDRAWAYACLALAQRLLAVSGPIATEDGVGKIAPLISALGGKDPFVAGAAAVLLAQIGYLAPEGEDTGYLDREVPEALVKTVASHSYYRDFNSLLPHALRALQLISGEGGARRGGEWASWWLENRGRFRAMRWSTKLAFSQGLDFSLDWIRPGESPDRIRFATETSALSGGWGEEYCFDRAQADRILKSLREASARTTGAAAPGAGDAEGVSFRFFRDGKGGALRWPSRETGDSPEQGFARLLQECREQNLWQLFPDLTAYANREEFLRGEMPWWSQESKPELRALRFKGTILRALPGGASKLRLLGLTLLQSRPELVAAFSREDVPAVLAIAEAKDEAVEVRELAVALSLRLNEEKTSARLLDNLCAQGSADARTLLRKAFSLLGAAAARRGMEDARPLARATAAEAFAAFRMPGSAEPLLRLLQDPELPVRSSAIYALGVLASPDTLDAVIAAAEPAKSADSARDGVEPSPLRAPCCLAAGRIGGEKAIPFLSRMLGDPELSVRSAAVQGLAEMPGAQSASLLAEITFRDSQPELASLAEEHLLACANESVISSLRGKLTAEKPPTRRRAVTLLAELRDREAAKPLIELLRGDPKDAGLLEVGSILCVQDLFAAPDASAALLAWSKTAPEPQPSLEEAPQKVEDLRSKSWFARVAALRALRQASGTPYPRLTRHSPPQEWERAYLFFRKFVQQRSEKSGQ